MSQVERVLDAQTVPREDTYGVMCGVGPDGSFVPIATDASGNILITTQGTPGMVPDSVTLTRSSVYSPVAGVNPQGNSQIFAVDAQGRLLVVVSGGNGPVIAITAPDSTGTIDSTALFQAAANAVAATGGTVHVRAGLYFIGGTVTFPNPVAIVGEGCGSIANVTGGGAAIGAGFLPGGHHDPHQPHGGRRVRVQRQRLFVPGFRVDQSDHRRAHGGSGVPAQSLSRRLLRARARQRLLRRHPFRQRLPANRQPLPHFRRRPCRDLDREPADPRRRRRVHPR